MKQGKKLRYNTFNRIGYKNLVAVQLNFILLYFNIAFNLREIENSGKLERIINIKMNIEQRLFAGRIKFPVKF